MKKIAFVTGSARGIGYATARLLAENGYHAVLSDILPAEKGGDVVKKLREAGLSCEYIPCDISKTDARERAFSAIQTEHGRLDVIVNNAGVAPLVRADLLDTGEESFDRVLGINLRGTFFMCQKAANMMIAFKEKGLEDYSPRIVNIGSMSAYTSSPNRPEYCISKAGIGMVTKLFGDRLAEYGIPVFEVRPGIVQTEMTSTVHEKYEKLIDGGVTPIRRFGQPEDIARTVLAACGGLLDFTTAQVLNADGGFHLRRL